MNAVMRQGKRIVLAVASGAPPTSNIVKKALAKQMFQPQVRKTLVAKPQKFIEEQEEEEVHEEVRTVTKTKTKKKTTTRQRASVARAAANEDVDLDDTDGEDDFEDEDDGASKDSMVVSDEEESDGNASFEPDGSEDDEDDESQDANDSDVEIVTPGAWRDFASQVPPRPVPGVKDSKPLDLVQRLYEELKEIVHGVGIKTAFARRYLGPSDRVPFLYFHHHRLLPSKAWNWTMASTKYSN